MKAILFFFLMIAFTISACSPKKSPNIEGAWKLVHSRTITGNSSFIDFPGKTDKDETKIWSGNQFMVVARIKNDTTVDDMYILGTYTLQGNQYAENIRIFNYKPWEGKTIKMTLEVKNDTLIQTFPFDDKGQLDKNWASTEKYIRIK
jgi:hypothetical protein